MRTLILISLCTILLTSCSHEEPIVHRSDYLIHLSAEASAMRSDKLNEQLVFWQTKLDASPHNAIYLKKIAGLRAEEFRLTHEISSLLQSDEILRSLHERFPNDVGTLHRLVANSITQHDFNQALDYAEKAFQVGEKKHLSQLLIVDVMLEKGDNIGAQRLLGSLKGNNRFDKQIRSVKLHDAAGDLDKAIEVMELALADAKASNNRELMTWSLSNLGDMYGHQGRIEKSYDTYLESLTLDASDAHSLKGIGWIALSHDRDIESAIEIWEHLMDRAADPELNLLLAEAYEQLGNTEKADEYLRSFIARTSQKEYGNMYASYLVELFDGSDASLGLKMAQADIDQREHPVTYSKYALALHKAGRSHEAIAIIVDHVIGRTEEPDALYVSGVIFDDAGLDREAEELLEEALAASYELGPSAESDIKTRLISL